MATQLDLDAESETLIDDLMASGRFATRMEAVRHSLRLAVDDEHVADAPLSAAAIAELERRIAEADADPDGGIPAEEVFAELRERYKNWK